MSKVVILINSLEMGGAERVVSTLLNNLSSEYECYLILIENKIQYELNPKIKIISLDESSTNSPLKKFMRLGIVAKKLSQVIKQNDFGVVTSFLNRANYINILSNMYIKHKTIISERAMPSLQHKEGVNGLINRVLIRVLYPFATLCISNSLGNNQDLKDNFGVKNGISIPNPFDIQNIVSLSKQDVDFAKRRFTLISVGRLDSGKNHKLIIDAINGLDIDLYIIGDGVLMEYLREYITDTNMQDNVFLLGKQTNPFKYLAQCDCFVFASNNEGFPNVLVEAMACGLPIISTDCKSGPREILAPNSEDLLFVQNDKVEFATYGILTPIKDVQKLREAIRLIISNSDIRAMYANKSLIRAREFDIDTIITKYKDVICVE